VAYTQPDSYLDFCQSDRTDPASGEPNVVVPSTPHKNYGWSFNEKPPFQYFNWLFRYADLWVKWLWQELQALVTSDIANDSSVTGTTCKDALENLATDMTELTTDDIANSSGLPGATASAALNALDARQISFEGLTMVKGTSGDEQRVITKIGQAASTAQNLGFNIRLTDARTKILIDATGLAGSAYVYGGPSTTTGGCSAAAVAAIAAWAPAMSNPLWVHVFLMYNVTTGHVDIGFDNNADASSLYDGDWYAFRRIGSMRLMASGGKAIITPFFQSNERFLWNTELDSYNDALAVGTGYYIPLDVPAVPGVVAMVAADITEVHAFILTFSDGPLASASSLGVRATSGPEGFSVLNGDFLVDSFARINAGVQTFDIASLIVRTRGYLDPRGAISY